MDRRPVMAALLAVFLCLAITPSSFAQDVDLAKAPKTTRLKMSKYYDTLQVGEPLLLHKKIAVFPIISEHQNAAAFEVILGTVSKADPRVKIAETSSTDKLKVTNSTKKPIFFVKGTIFQGKTQNRMLEIDFIVQPGETLDVSTRCVEKKQDFEAGKTLKPSQHIAPPSVRFGFAGNQQAVWSRIQEMLAQGGIESEKKDILAAYSRLIDGTGKSKREKRLHRRFGAMKDEIDEALEELPNVVGFLFALPKGKKGKPIYFIEIFQNTPLFAKHSAAIINSVLVEALLSPWQFKMANFGERFKFFKKLVRGAQLKRSEASPSLWTGSVTKDGATLSIESLVVGTVKNPVHLHTFGSSESMLPGEGS